MLLVLALACSSPSTPDAAPAPPGFAPSPEVLAAAPQLRPTDAILFLEPGTAVSTATEAWFRAYSTATGGKLAVRVVDQAVVPALAEQYKVRENGTVVLARGDAFEKFKLGTDPERAARELARLDGSVAAMLASLDVAPSRIALTTAHEERRSTLFEQAIADVTMGTITDVGALTTATTGTVLVVDAPKTAWSADEAAAFASWLDTGRRALLVVEPGDDDLAALLGPLGLAASAAPLASTSSSVRQDGSDRDHLILATDRYGDHPAARGIEREGALITWTGALLTATDPRWSALVRPPTDAWLDADADGVHDADEVAAPAGALAMAASGTGKGGEWRVVVLGDTDMLGASLLGASRTNQELVLGALQWLGPERPPPTADADAHPAAIALPDVPAAPPVDLVPAPPARFEWAGADGTMTCERRTDAAGTYEWCVISGDKPARFPASTLDPVGRLTALRAIDLTGVDPAVLGFATPYATLDVDGRKLVIGGETYGARDRFVQADGRVWLVDGDALRLLEFAGTRLIDRRLAPEHVVSAAIAGVALSETALDALGDLRATSWADAAPASARSLATIDARTERDAWTIELLADGDTTWARSTWGRAVAKLPRGQAQALLDAMPQIPGATR
jgi:hypothetical protein